MTSASAVRTSMIFPFPSSPHCAPIKMVFDIGFEIGQKIFRTHSGSHPRIKAPASDARPIVRGGRPKKELRSKSLFRKPLPMRTILLVILVLLLIGALPTWPYSSGWGYYPSGGLILLIIIVLLLVRA